MPRPMVRGSIEDEASADGWFGPPSGSAPSSPSLSPPPPAAMKKDAEEKTARARDSMKAEGGASGVAAAREIGKLKGGNTTSQRAVTTVQRAMGRVFTFKGGAFVDNGVTGKEKTLSVQAYSDAWFQVLKLRPDLKEALALGEAVKVVVGAGKVLVVDGSAPAKVAEADLKAFLAR